MTDERLTAEEMAHGIIQICHCHLESEEKIASQIRAYGDQRAAEAREVALEEAKALIQKWIDAYPEDIFVPVDKNEQTAVNKVFISRISAQHGRHMGKRLLEDINQLAASPAPESK